MATFEVRIHYTGTLTYIVKAATPKQAKNVAEELYARAVTPDPVMADYERIVATVVHKVKK